MKLLLHKTMSNQEIADVFGFIAGVLKLHDENPFRVRAYDNAATTISQLEQPLHKMFLQGPHFDKIPGIGAILQEKLIELFTSGDVKAFQEYVADIPAGTFALWKVHGIGVKKGFVLASEFHLDDEKTALEKTLKAAEAGKIRTLPGFGEKSEADIKEAIEHHAFAQKGRLPFAQAQKAADELKNYLEKCPAIHKIETLGSLRRHAETVGDIDIGLAVSSADELKSFLSTVPIIKRVVASGDQLIRVMLNSGQQVDMKIATPSEWGSFLQHFTGSKEHNIRLREFALRQDKSLSEHGIKIISGPEKGVQKQFATEESFYHFLGLNWIPPEKRLGSGEIEAAKM